MSTIDLDRATLLSLDDADWRLLALADERPARLRRHPASYAPARDAAEPLIAVAVACAAHDAADADLRSWAPAAPRAAAYPTVEPPSVPGERECALGPSIAPEL